MNTRFEKIVQRLRGRVETVMAVRIKRTHKEGRAVRDRVQTLFGGRAARLKSRHFHEKHFAYVGRTASDVSASEDSNEDQQGTSSSFNSDLETLIRDDSALSRVVVKDSSMLDVISKPVDSEMKQQTENLRNVVGERHPLLLTAADHIFNAGGKRIRPLITLLVAKATRKLYGYEDVTSEQIRLSMVSEMIHTASLVHDDVLDDCDLRRGKGTVHSLYGTRVAVLAGDFLFAQSSWFLANLNNLEVIKLISQVRKEVHLF